MVPVQLQLFNPDTICTQPGVPGSSPACVTCTASCSPDPAEFDPAEADYWNAVTTSVVGVLVPLAQR